MVYGGIEFTMDGLRGMVWGLIEEEKRSMKRVVFGRDREEDKMPVIRWEELRDDGNRNEIGLRLCNMRRIDGWSMGKRGWE